MDVLTAKEIELSEIKRSGRFDNRGDLNFYISDLIDTLQEAHLYSEELIDVILDFIYDSFESF